MGPLALLIYLGGLVPEARWQWQRRCERETMATMRELGVAVAAHRRKAGRLPDSLAEVHRAGTLDGFGNPYRYTRDPMADRWTLVSTGADGREQGVQQQLFAYMDCDIIYFGEEDSTGQFSQSPEGVSMGKILGPGWSYRWFAPLRVMYGAR